MHENGCNNVWVCITKCTSFLLVFVRALKAFISVSFCGYSMLMFLMYKVFLMARKSNAGFKPALKIICITWSTPNEMISSVTTQMCIWVKNLKLFSWNQNTSTRMDTDWHLSSSASSDGPWYDGRQHNLRFNYSLKNVV